MILNTFIKLKMILEKKEYNKMYFFLALSFLAMLLEILSVGLIIPFLNSLVSGEISLDIFKIFNFIEGLSINYIITILIVVYSFKAIFLTFFTFLQSKYLAGIRAGLSNKLFKLYINRSYDFHLKNNTSKLIRNVGETNLIVLVIKAMITFVNEFLVMFGISLFIIIFQPKISFFVIIILSLIGFLFYKTVQGKMRFWGKIRQESTGNLLKIQNESFRLIKEIKILNRAKHIFEKFFSNNDKIVQSEFKHSFISSLPRLWLEWLVIVTFLSAVSFMVLDGKNLSEIIVVIGVFTAAAFRIMPSLTKIMNSIQAILYQQVVLNTVSEQVQSLSKANLDHPTDKKDISSKRDFSLKVENLGFSYNNSKTVFKEINLQFDKGKIYGICGPSGSGKTTLINLILGFLQPLKGKILFNEENIFNNLRSWRNNIGFVPQEIFLFDGTIKENILLYLPEKEINTIDLDNSIKNANLDEFINSSDKGLDTGIGEFGDKISGGQKQRVGISRAILSKPKVLILDEFTSSLDTKTEEKILNEITFLKKDRIIIIISHRLSTLNLCDEIFKFDKEKLIQTK
ncbi:hypothetical protein CBE37_01500 [bacterium TMED277]|nr:hypothetical protein [Candidatus Pelagibacter sp.]OUX44220.1 MAG: hypothetical protein CBE37_01500 [bacterium TMED277]|tara:strand:- start:2620 stop:4329 length:1710 start_codon:yes stop_codon:yes gene_type:complete